MSTLGGPIQITTRNIWALVLRDMQTQYGGRALGYLWGILDPMGLIAVLGIVFYFVGHPSPLGGSPLLFFATGVIPLRTYSKTVMKVGKVPQSSKSLLYFPIIKPIDAFIATVLLQVFTMLMALLFFIVGFYVIDGSGIPDDWFNTFIPFAFMAVYAFSLGVISSVMMIYFKFWDKIWKMLNRPTFIISGIFFLADSLPLSAQKVLYYNPFLHCVEWARSGYYATFESKFCDPNYIYVTAGGLLFIALLLERMFRRQLLSSA